MEEHDCVPGPEPEPEPEPEPVCGQLLVFNYDFYAANCSWLLYTDNPENNTSISYAFEEGVMTNYNDVFSNSLVDLGPRGYRHEIVLAVPVGTYTLELSDSFGNGWVGGLVDGTKAVQINGKDYEFTGGTGRSISFAVVEEHDCVHVPTHAEAFVGLNPGDIPDGGCIPGYAMMKAFNYNDQNIFIDIKWAHTYNSDLNVSLIIPSGTELILWKYLGSFYDDGHVLITSSATDILPAQFTLSSEFTFPTEQYATAYLPQGGEDVFNVKEDAGQWILKVCDDDGGAVGTVLHAYIWFEDREPEPEPCPGDVTGDGNVNVSDLLNVIKNWGCGTEPAPEPEPEAEPEAG